MKNRGLLARSPHDPPRAEAASISPAPLPGSGSAAPVADLYWKEGDSWAEGRARALPRKLPPSFLPLMSWALEGQPIPGGLGLGKAGGEVWVLRSGAWGLRTGIRG